MRKLLFVLSLLTVVSAAKAELRFFDPFSYVDGQLTAVSGGIWGNNTGTGNFLQVLGGEVTGLSAGSGSREDVVATLNRVISASSEIAYSGFDLSLGASPTGAAYFFHLQLGASGTGTFVQRTFLAAPETSGFRLGLGLNNAVDTATASTIPALTGDLLLNTTYRVVTKYDIASQTVALWVGTDPSTFVESSPMITLGSVGAITTDLGRVNFRQGGTATYAGLDIDNLSVATDFATAVVPEPSATLILLSGGFALIARRPRRG